MNTFCLSLGFGRDGHVARGGGMYWGGGMVGVGFLVLESEPLCLSTQFVIFFEAQINVEQCCFSAFFTQFCEVFE